MEFSIRKAKKSDKEPLMEFIRDVWGGHDYIPQVWDEWIEDGRAKMFVADVGGRPIALNRVRFLEDGSAWFEGVRVHPDFRGRGVATALGENSVKVASSRGARVFRLTSGSRNRAAHRQISRMKFGEVSRFSVYNPMKGEGLRPLKGVKVAGRRDVDGLMGVIWSSEEYRLGRGVMWDGFTAFEINHRIVAKSVGNGEVFLLDDAVAFSRPGREGRDVWSQVCFVCGNPRSAVRLVSHIFALSRGADWRLAYLPQGSPIIGELRRNGFKRSYSVILFQRKAAKG